MKEPTRDELYEVIAIQAVEIIALKDRVSTLRNLRKYDEERIAELEKGLKLYQDESAELWQKIAELEAENDSLKATIADKEEEIKNQNVAWEELLTDMYHYRDKYEALKAEKEERQTATISADDMEKEEQNG